MGDIRKPPGLGNLKFLDFFGKTFFIQQVSVNKYGNGNNQYQ